MRLVYITLGWTLGIVLAATLVSLPADIWLAAAALCVIAFWLVRAHPAYRIAGITFVAFALGGLRYAFVPTTSALAGYNNSGGLTIEGVVTDEPDVRDDRIQLRVWAETISRAGQTQPISGLALVRAPRTAEVHYGDRVRATGLLITPAEFDTFSYADYLARSGVFSIMPNAAVEVVSSGKGSSALAGLLDLKGRARTAIARYLPEPQAGLLTGILLGNERGISAELAEAFSAVGASHVIAISGFNMVIISGVVMRIFSRLTTRGWLAGLMGIGVIATYTVFVGANPAVVRAAVMSSMLVVAPLLKRKTYVPASLAFVALVMSAQNPTVLWDVSFQLSFFATLGLALFVEPLMGYFDRVLHNLFPRSTANWLAGFLAEPLIVTLAAQITTLPLIIAYFGRVSLVMVLVNLLIIPIQTPLLILGGLAILVAIIAPPVAQILFWLDLILLSWTIGVVRAFSALPFADVEFHVDPRLVAVFLTAVIGGALMHATQPRWWVALGRFARQRAVVTAAIFSALGIVFLTGAAYLSRPDGLLHVWLLDVGHSNAVLVQTPGGAHMLVDGGRFPSRLLTAIGDRLPFTDREIEVLAVTQPDEFEFGALSAALARYDIGVALLNGQPNLSEAFAALQDALAVHEIVTVRAGYTLDFDDGARLEVLNPQAQPELGDSLDDNAVVIRVTFGDVSFLLTSDLSAEGQRTLLESGQWPLATVLQLPQHGTARSLDEDFLKATQPQVVVVQSDKANRRGDPAPDTLAMLGDTPVFRTDESGALHLWTDGSALWLGRER